MICDFVKKELGIPSVTAMWRENPAVNMYVKDNYIVSKSETAAGMSKSLPVLTKLALKLAKKEAIGPARLEGYIRTNHRYLVTTGGLVPVGNPDKAKLASDGVLTPPDA